MKISIKRKTWNLIKYCLALAVLAFSVFVGLSFNSQDVVGLNISNQTIIARVNVSNTEPTLYRVALTSPTPPIDLVANNGTTVVCNGSVIDINGFNDIKNVSATFFYISDLSNSSDDNNTHYTNSSCGPCAVVVGTGSQNGTCSCQFGVQYYANAGRWTCNMTVNDSGGLMSNANGSAIVNEILGIDVENYIMDFGNLSATQVSTFFRQNVTNTGNVAINVSVRGFGGGDETIGQNLSMICESGGNISFGSMRYAQNNNTLFSDMENITNQSRRIGNFTVGQRFKDSAVGNSTNSTYWKLQIPLGVGGICNGSIVFKAIETY